jgi:ABC-2 type transport system ATP-binding protein
MVETWMAQAANKSQTVNVNVVMSAGLPSISSVWPGDVVAVAGLSLHVQRGECFGLLGPNGAGKTTTIEILEGLTVPDAGEVRVLGRQWGTHERELRGRLGISLQETRFSEKLTVYETLDLFRSLYPRGRDPELLLSDMSLEEKRDARVGKISGGQRQRLAVACALAGDPEILFLDEPTTGLDPVSRNAVWSEVRDLNTQAGVTIFLTTQYLEEADELADRIGIIAKGTIAAEGTPAELKRTVGERVYRSFFPHHLRNHDAEDRANLTEIGAKCAASPNLWPLYLVTY